MRIMILGAAGFIGGQIARAAAARGWEVHGLRRNTSSTGALGDLPLHWHTGDLVDTAALTQTIRGCDVLYHAAGYYPSIEHAIRPAMRRAASEMRSVLTAARQASIPRVVYTSSLSTIGMPTNASRLAHERDAYLPGSVPSAYYEAKWIMEQEALRAVIEGLPVITLIPSAVFGPGDVKPTTSELLLMIARRRVPVALDVEMNFVDGRDVAEAHIAAAEHGEPGQRTIIGGYNLNVADVIRQTAEIAGVRPPRRTLSHRSTSRLMRVAHVLRLPVPDLLFGIDHFQPLDASKGWQTFGFTPRPFADTLRDTLDWFRAHGYL